MAPKKRLGTGAKSTVLARYIHPSKRINDVFPNRTHQQRVERKRGKSDKKGCIIFTHLSFSGEELFCVKRWAKVTEEGPPDGFFVVGGGGLDVETDVEEAVGVGEIIPDAVLHASGRREDVALIKGMGFMVDDNNEPSPENIPSPEPTQGDENENHAKAVWEFDGIDERKK